MRKSLFTAALTLTITMAMIATMGISNVSAQIIPHPEVVIRPGLVTGTTDPTVPPYGYAAYYVNIKNAPHHDLEGVSPDTYSKTWSWQIEVTWDPTVLGDPYVSEDTYSVPGRSAALLGYFFYWEWVVVPYPHWEKKPYPRSGLTTPPAPWGGKVTIFDGLKAAPDPATVPIYAGDPEAGLHLGSNYDLPYSEGIDISAYNPMYGPNELSLCILSFPILKNGPANATAITVEAGVGTFFYCRDSTTEYYPSLPQAWFGVEGPHLHSTGSPIPDPSDPVGTSWHELYPNYCYEYDLIQFRDDNGDGVLSYCDEILLHPTEPAGADLWYHVEEVTITIFVNKKDEAGDPTGETMYIDLELPADVLPDEVYTPIKEPVCTQWHELYPDYCRRYHLTDWEDTGPDNPGELGVSDQIQLTDKETGEAAWYHVDDICTDIVVTPEPGKIVPEFPLGIGLMIAIAPAIPIVYLWRTRKKEE